MRHCVEISLLVLLFVAQPFSIGDITDKASQDAIFRILSPWYPVEGRDQILVVTFDNDLIDSRSNVSYPWPVPYDIHSELLDNLIAGAPRAIIVDIALMQQPPQRGTSHDDFYGALTYSILDAIESNIPVVMVTRTVRDEHEARYTAENAAPARCLDGITEPGLLRLIELLKDEMGDDDGRQKLFNQFFTVASYDWLEMDGEYPVVSHPCGLLPAIEAYRMACRNEEPADSHSGSCQPSIVAALETYRAAHKTAQDPSIGVSSEIRRLMPNLTIQWGSFHYPEHWTSANERSNLCKKKVSQLFELTQNAQTLKTLDRTVAALSHSPPPNEICEPPYHVNISADNFFQTPAANLPDSDSRRILYEMVHDKFVFIGADLKPATDLHLSPLHGKLPGVYLHAMALDNLLSLPKNTPFQQAFYWKQISSPWFGVLLNIVLAVFFLVVLKWKYLDTPQQVYDSLGVRKACDPDKKAALSHLLKARLTYMGVVLLSLFCLLCLFHTLKISPFNWVALSILVSAIEIVPFTTNLIQRARCPSSYVIRQLKTHASLLPIKLQRNYRD